MTAGCGQGCWILLSSPAVLITHTRWSWCWSQSFTCSEQRWSPGAALTAAVWMSMKGRGSKYQKRVSFSEDEDEQCWKEENGGVDAHHLKSVSTVSDSSGYNRYNMWVFIQLYKLTLISLISVIKQWNEKQRVKRQTKSF